MSGLLGRLVAFVTTEYKDLKQEEEEYLKEGNCLGAGLVKADMISVIFRV